MFLRGLWDISLNGGLIEISQRHLMVAGKWATDFRKGFGLVLIKNSFKYNMDILIFCF